MRGLCSRPAAVVLLLLLALWVTAAGAQVPARASAEEVKAAFLYNFAAFVEWPREARTRRPFVIGISGSEGVEAELRSAVSGRKLEDRPIAVKRVERPEDVQGVHILFVGESARLPRLLRPAIEQHALVVTDDADGLAHGSAINFVTRERVQFEISLQAAAQAGLRLSARLLSVALRVRKGEAPPALLLADAGRPTKGG